MRFDQCATRFGQFGEALGYRGQRPVPKRIVPMDTEGVGRFPEHKMKGPRAILSELLRGELGWMYLRKVVRALLITRELLPQHILKFLGEIPPSSIVYSVAVSSKESGLLLRKSEYSGFL